MAQNFEGAWPDIGQQIASSLTNVPTTAAPTPTVTAQNPFGAPVEAGSSRPPHHSPTTSGSSTRTSKNPYSEQWNFGVQQQLSQFIGLENGLRRLRVASHQRRRPIQHRSHTRSRRHASQGRSIPTAFRPFMTAASAMATTTPFRCNWTSAIPVASRYQIAYTWSKSQTEDDGWFGVGRAGGAGSLQPRSVPRVVLGPIFPMCSLLTVSMRSLSVGARDFPPATAFGDYILGNWQLNSIFTWRNGQSYTVYDSATSPTSETQQLRTR